MEIRLLGALEVLDDAGSVISLPGAKRRALLAILALRPGQTVSGDRLIEELWGSEAGESARNSLQVLVSKLRRSLPEDAVATRPLGYALEIPAGSVDIVRFRQLSAEGRRALAAGDPGGAVAPLRQALGMWRGEALADFVYEVFARDEIAQLTEERWAVFEDRVEADLACGRHADLVPELEAAVRASPLRERVRCQLMLALYRSGRQADALRQYQAARMALGEELGLEPGPELRSLEAKILAHSPSLSAATTASTPPKDATAESAPPVPASAHGPPAASLVGREEQLAQLRAALDRAEAGARSVVLVSGESGIGKTELVREATRGRALLAWGTCVDDAAVGGLWPWSRAIEQLTRALGVELSRRLAGADAELLATIAHSFGRKRVRSGTARDQLVLLDAICRWLEAVASRAPVVVVLDDLQWADGSTLSLLDLAARSPQPAALCVIGCYRPGELGEPARAQLPRLATAVQHIDLEGLDRDAVAALVSPAGTLLPADLEEIYRRAGGHPVFTRELALVFAKGEPATIPSAVRDAIELRVGRLSDETRHALEVAALAGNDVHPGLVATVLGTTPAEVETACRAALRAGMLTETANGLRFAHDLYRETLAASVASARRAALHLAIGSELEARHLRGSTANAADVARHFIAAVALDGPDRAARWALAAAAADRSAFAFGEAAGQLRRWRGAVEEDGVVVDDELRLEMLLAEADALARAGKPAEARALLRIARDIATRTRDWLRLGEVALAVGQLGAVFSARRDEVVRELECALTAVSGRDSALEARLAARLARELQHSVASDRPRAVPLSEHALRLGREAGDPETLIACLLAHHDVLWTPGEAAARVEVANEIVRTAERAGSGEYRGEGLLLLANALLEQASGAFAAALEQCLDQLDKLGQPRHRYVCETRRACVALLRGELEDAARLIDSAADLGRRIHEPEASLVQTAQRLELVRARGQPDELIAFTNEAKSAWSGAPTFAHGLGAGFLARAGELDGARRHVAAVVDLGGWRLERSYAWTGLVRELSLAAVATGDRALCSQLLADVLPFAGTCGVSGAVVAFSGSHAHTAGVLTAALGGESGALFSQAREAYTRLGATAWLSELDRHEAAGANRGASLVSSTGARGQASV
jgi:DNA-binding SARP family transcriptional activator